MHLIAEAGNNHNGSVETALELVDLAARAGADSVKFQVIYPEGLYLPEIPVENGYEPNEVIAARRAHQLSDDEYRRIARHCEEAGVAFSASVFDSAGIALLDELDVPYIKLASCDLNNVPLVREAAATGRRVVLSTGMSTLEEVERSVGAARGEGCEDLVLMHCVSVYPASLEQMNIGFIDELARFDCELGLSDHTGGSTAAAMALARGASWFEKHFTLDSSQPGFDHAYALEPEALISYAAELRDAAGALSQPSSKVGPQEAEVAERARRSVYAARDLPVDHVIAPEDLVIVRPQGALEPADAETLVGRRTRQEVRRYEPMRWELVG